MLTGIIEQMLRALREPAYNKRLRLGVDYLEIDALSVLLAESMPVAAEVEPEVDDQTNEHFSGIPPPANDTHSAGTFTRDEAELRNPAFPSRAWERERVTEYA